MEIKVWYDDGFVYQGPHEDAPPLGVLALVDDQNRPYREFDWYTFQSGEWIGMNSIVDLLDHILHRPVEKVLKGRMAPGPVWDWAVHEVHITINARRQDGTTREIGSGNHGR